jgi:hypothetical protein
MDAAKVTAVAPAEGASEAPPVTKGRFTVKHVSPIITGYIGCEDIISILIIYLTHSQIKSDPGPGRLLPADASGVATPEPASPLVAPGPAQAGGQDQSQSQDKQTPVVVVQKKSRFTVKTKTAKEDDRSDGAHDGASSPALRGSQQGQQQAPSAAHASGHGLVRVPSGTNISLLRQPSSQPAPSSSSSAASSRSQLRDDQIDKIHHMVDLNNRVRYMCVDLCCPAPAPPRPLALMCCCRLLCVTDYAFLTVYCVVFALPLPLDAEGTARGPGAAL